MRLQHYKILPQIQYRDLMSLRNTLEGFYATPINPILYLPLLSEQNHPTTRNELSLKPPEASVKISEPRAYHQAEWEAPRRQRKNVIKREK